METNNQDLFAQNPQPQNSESTESKKSPLRFQIPKCPFSLLLSIVTLAVAFTVLLTYTLTANAKREYYVEKLAAQQQVIDQLKEDSFDPTTDLSKVAVIAELIDRYAYYASNLTEEELLRSVIEAYAEKMGDDYATYYTAEEYKELMEQNAGVYQGIGITVIYDRIEVENREYDVYQIISIDQNSPANKADLKIGDCIYSIKKDGAFQTVEELGGHEFAINLIRGPKGTQAEFQVFRANEQTYQSFDFSITRDEYETVSVSYTTYYLDSKVGIVHISKFDITTPNQFKNAIDTLKSQGVERFVLDVRNNPGGDLKSIKAVLTYFLQKGDLILSAIDKNGNVAKSYYSQSELYEDEYEGCSVSEAEIGMYADLDMVVLCNQNTASAAEVFTATMRDYQLATIVGEKTFGKGIMQSYLPLSMLGNYSGVIKFTTYAYVTKCNVTYHDIGIAPSVEVTLSDEAKQYHFYTLPQEKDNQLLVAIQQFQ